MLLVTAAAAMRGTMLNNNTRQIAFVQRWRPPTGALAADAQIFICTRRQYDAPVRCISMGFGYWVRVFARRLFRLRSVIQRLSAGALSTRAAVCAYKSILCGGPSDRRLF